MSFPRGVGPTSCPCQKYKRTQGQGCDASALGRPPQISSDLLACGVAALNGVGESHARTRILDWVTEDADLTSVKELMQYLHRIQDPESRLYFIRNFVPYVETELCGLIDDWLALIERVPDYSVRARILKEFVDVAGKQFSSFQAKRLIN
jgi:hypothetical protein